MAPGRTGAGAAVRARLMLALALASVLSGPPAAACPTKCTCSAASVDCHGLGLRAVPRGIPRNAERLDLDRNNITRITKTDFAGLKNLRVLHLEDNQVSIIERGAFQDLKQLERLRLNKNKLQVLPELLFQSNLKLTRLSPGPEPAGRLPLSTCRLTPLCLGAPPLAPPFDGALADWHNVLTVLRSENQESSLVFVPEGSQGRTPVGLAGTVCPSLD
uniref:Uncharacterized protein n=1 Tax=Rangifer tarandus platyrhynchus TaxID=3082113 RepID=A0ACB0E532_RANTA|nr:unnamed protein product [Rangifer tarandus platyrhynchus]